MSGKRLYYVKNRIKLREKTCKYREGKKNHSRTMEKASLKVFILYAPRPAREPVWPKGEHARQEDQRVP